MDTDLLHRAVLHLPVVTTLCAAYFCFELFSRYRAKGGGLHLLWWGIGMATYGVGTFTEAWTSIVGWDPTVFRFWYIAGAFLGGYPLAQGSIYLLMKKRFAHTSAVVVTSVIAVASVFVFLTPLDTSLAEAHRLSGSVIEWQGVRLVSPFINIYSVIFLAGGAVVSALRFRRAPQLRHRYIGNILIAVGAILPGIGGSMTRAGYVEALYVTELAGLILIYIGYRYNVSGKPVPSPRVRASVAAAGRQESLMRRSSLPLLLVMAFLALPAWAQSDATPTTADAAATDEATDSTQAEEGDDTGELASFFASTTVTATGTERSAFEVSTPVSVINGDQIQRLQPENPADLLRTMPGVDVDGVGPNQARPVIRGLRGLRVLFLENGLRLNNPRRQTDFGEITALSDISDARQVEVIRGPASVLYGSDAIGGVLNVITRQPGFSSGSRLAASLGLGYGSAGDRGNANAWVEGGEGSWAWRLNGSYRDSGDYDAPGGSYGNITLAGDTPVVDTGVQDSNFSGFLGYQIDESHQLSLRATRYRAEETGFGFVEPELLGGEDEGFRIQILYPYQDFDRFNLGYTGTFAGGSLADSLDVQLYHQNNERELANNIDINIGPIFPGAPDSEVLADTLNFTDLETLGLRVEAVKLAGDKHLLTYGVEGYEDDSTNTDFSETTSIIRFPFPPFEIVDVMTDDIANAPNATNRSYGVFVQDEILATDRLRITAGARYQVVETRAEATPGWDVTGLDFNDDAVVGSLNVSWGVTDYLRLVAGYGTAFRAPNLIERLFNGPTPEGAGFQILNPDLQSETSENIDLGLKYLRSNAVFELIYFRNDIQDGIIQYFLSPDEVAALPQDVQDEIGALGSGVFVVQQRNIEELRWEGVEMVIGYRLENGISVGGNYTHLDGKRRDSTNPPTGDSVGDKYNAYVRWDRPTGRRVWAEYRLRHNEDQKANLDPNEPPPTVGLVLPAFTIHTLGAGVRLFETPSQSHDLTLIVDNLTDELYAEFSNATFFRPQPGRTYSVSYRMSF